MISFTSAAEIWASQLALLLGTVSETMDDEACPFKKSQSITESK